MAVAIGRAAPLAAVQLPFQATASAVASATARAALPASSAVCSSDYSDGLSCCGVSGRAVGSSISTPLGAEWRTGSSSSTGGGGGRCSWAGCCSSWHCRRRRTLCESVAAAASAPDSGGGASDWEIGSLGPGRGSTGGKLPIGHLSDSDDGGGSGKFGFRSDGRVSERTFLPDSDEGAALVERDERFEDEEDEEDEEEEEEGENGNGSWGASSFAPRAGSDGLDSVAFAVEEQGTGYPTSQDLAAAVEDGIRGSEMAESRKGSGLAVPSAEADAAAATAVRSEVTSANGSVVEQPRAQDEQTQASEQEQHQQRPWLSSLLALVVLRLRLALRAVRSVLPGGSWWDIGAAREGPQMADTLDALKKLWQLTTPDRGMLALCFVFLAAAALSEVAIPHYLAATIFAASTSAQEKFASNARVLAALTVACGVFSGLRSSCFGILNIKMVRRMRAKLFSNILHQDIAFFDRESVGDLTSRLGSDCQSVSSVISYDMNIMLRNFLQGVGALFFLVRLSWQMTVVTAVLCVIMWYCLLRYGRFQRESAKVVQDTVAAANEVAEESFSLARVVRAFGAEKHEVSRYKRPLNRLVQIGLRRSVASGLWTCGGNTIYNAVQVVALVAGGSAVMSQQITAEQLTKFILYSEWVVHATWWVGDHWASLMEAIGSCDRVFRLLDMPHAPQLRQVATNAARTLPHLQGKIEFRNVTFSYPTRPSIPVLDDISLVIEPGELVALVGLSGSGKSTLVGLLQRLYEPTSGKVLVDDFALDELDVMWFRRQLGVVSQEPRLFSTDITSNIAYGTKVAPSQQPHNGSFTTNGSATVGSSSSSSSSGSSMTEEIRRLTQAEVEAAARAAHVHTFVESLPDGYRTRVDNSRLSGGQRQRIAIARALVRDPRILILDEATSALDAESEHNVQKALDEAISNGAGQRRKRTVIVIAHRLSTIRAADRIVVMSAGRITEMGTHDELMAMGGEYARLNARQMADATLAEPDQ